MVFEKISALRTKIIRQASDAGHLKIPASSTKKKKKVAKWHRLTHFEPRNGDFGVEIFADFLRCP